jgi:hypothetical protein
MRILNRKFFGLHPKVKLTQPNYACIFVAITMVGPTKVSIMKLKCTELNRMSQHDFMMKQKYFSVRYFCLETQAGWLSRLATRATIPGTPCRCHVKIRVMIISWKLIAVRRTDKRCDVQQGTCKMKTIPHLVQHNKDSILTISYIV